MFKCPSGNVCRNAMDWEKSSSALYRFDFFPKNELVCARISNNSYTLSGNRSCSALKCFIYQAHKFTFQQVIL